MSVHAGTITSTLNMTGRYCGRPYQVVKVSLVRSKIGLKEVSIVTDYNTDYIVGDKVSVEVTQVDAHLSSAKLLGRR